MILVKAGTRCQLFFCVGFLLFAPQFFTMQFTYLLAFGGGCVRVPAAICLEKATAVIVGKTQTI